VPKAGLAARAHGRSDFEIGGELLTLARGGLQRRRNLDASGQDETRYLEILDDRLDHGTTPAQELLDKYNAPWARSVDPIYSEQAY